MISPAVIHVDDLAYDYTQITDPTLRTLAQRAAEEIKPRLRRATEDILTIGARLATIRQHLPHGQWTDWIDTEFEMGDDTARNFINVAIRFTDKSRIIRDLKPTALYALAAPSTPDDAITQVEALITNGHTPTVAETKQIIAQHKPTSQLSANLPGDDWTRRSQPAAPATASEPQASASAGKLLIDWTDADWAAHNAKIEAAVLEVADAPGSVSDKRTKLSDEDEIRIATDWLSAYRGPHGANWSQMTDSQIHHANSPCFQAWTKAHPEVRDHKLRIKQAMYQLRRRASTLGASTTATQSPNHPISQSPNLPPTDNIELSPDRRAQRIAVAQSLPATTYNVILADPPWQYNNTGVNGAAANHYNTMTFSQLSALPDQIGLDIAPNAVLFCWTTNPMLADALELIHNWGFTYKTNIVWVKDRIGTGFYVRGMHELLLICTKGSMTPINPNSTPPITSVINAPTQEHSRKPDQVHDLIEQLYPDCNFIELFARRQRAGWDVWGNEVNQ